MFIHFLATRVLSVTFLCGVCQEGEDPFVIALRDIRQGESLRVASDDDGGESGEEESEG